MIVESPYESNSLIQENTNEKVLTALEKKIDLITRFLSKPYYNKILKDLLKTSPTNTKIIYDYIIAEQTELKHQRFN